MKTEKSLYRTVADGLNMGAKPNQTSTTEMPRVGLTYFENGQEFALIRYSNNGAHKPAVTSYPVENLAGLKSNWMPVSYAELNAEHAALLAVAEAAETLSAEASETCFAIELRKLERPTVK